MKRYTISVFLLLIISAQVFAQHPTFNKIDRLLNSYFEKEYFMGNVLVAENGNIIYRKSFGLANIEWNVPNRPEGIFNIASVTKVFVGTITMQLMQEGKIKPADKISDFLPYYRKDIGKLVTIHQLLTHSSGIPNYLQKPGFMQKDIRMRMESVKDFIIKYCSNDLEFEPGSKFAYNNSGFAILGAIIEKVTGNTFAQVLKERILAPCNMNNTGMDDSELLLYKRVKGYSRSLDGTFTVAPVWEPMQAYTAGQMYSTVDDLFKFHNALMGEKILTKKYKAMMFTEYFPAFGGSYGYGWMLKNLSDEKGSEILKMTSHEGGIYGFNLFFSRIPEKNQVVILLNNTGDAPLKIMAENIFSILNGLKYSMPKYSIARLVYKEIMKNGTESALKLYDKIKQNSAGDYEMGERELNSCGYFLLGKNQTDYAIEVFRKNIDEFPESFNTYDSLGEAYMIKGDKENAVKFYKKSLDLNPGNEGAKINLKKLGS